MHKRTTCGAVKSRLRLLAIFLICTFRFRCWFYSCCCCCCL